MNDLGSEYEKPSALDCASNETTGTYFWMVAVVSFDAQSKADGFSYSEPKSFIVP